jgi:branched-chain amino acid transport system permease protein
MAATGHSLLAAHRRHSRRILATVWILAIAYPFIAPNDYLQSLGVTFFLNLMLIASLNLVMGWTGQASLAHASFYGLGAYASGVLNVRYGLSPWLGSVVAVALVAAVAAFIGATTLRLRGPYVAMGTLGFSGIITVLFVELVPITGGPNGLSAIAPYPFFGIDLDTAMRFYWLAWIVSALVMWGFLNLYESAQGRALRAIAGSEIGANSLGVNTFAYKTVAFVLGAGVAGLAGALYVHFNMYASPETFGFSTSVLLVVMVAVGGTGLFWGPLFGAAVYTVVPELLRRYQDIELFVFGACMILVLLFMPGGIAGFANRLGWKKPRPAPAKASVPQATTKEAADGAPGY